MGSESMKMNTWIICTLAALVFLDVVWSTSNEFHQAPCPNRCSYEPHEAMNLTCSNPNTTVKVPNKIRHLTLFGCDDDNFPTFSNLSSIRSVTMKHNYERSHVYPVRLFRHFGHVVCIKLHGTIAFGQENVTAFGPLESLEYLELDDTVFHSRSDYLFHLSGFQEDFKLQSVVLSYGSWDLLGPSPLAVDIRDIVSPFYKSKPTCFTYQNKSSLVLDIHEDILLDNSLVEFFQNLEVFKIRDVYDLVTVNGSRRLFPGMINLFTKIKSVESSNAIKMYSICPISTSIKYLNENNFTFLDKCPGSKDMISLVMLSLEEIILHHSTFFSLCPEVIRTSCLFALNSTIKRIDLSYLTQKNVNIFDTIVYGLTELLYLNIEGNLVKYLPDLFLHFVPKLEVLLMGKNRLGNILANDHEGILFMKLNMLKHLDLSSNNIKRLPFDIFKGLENLELLNLTDNSLTQFEVNMWPINGINMISLKQNAIATVSVDTSYVIDKIKERIRNITVDLSDNAITCSCGDIESIKWLQSTQATLLNMDNYLCTNVQGQMVALKNIDVDVLHNFCHPLTNGQIAGIIVSVTILNMIVIFFIVAYKKRHEWRYKLFRIYYYRNSTRNSTQYKYDGYVCYSSQDYEWVQNQLLSNLEVEHGLKLCLDKRDFVVGNYITNNILESIEESRKTILIISPNFVKSQWCEYEMHMAHQKFLDQGHDVIVPVLYQELSGKQGNNLLKTIIRMKTYIAWDSSEGKIFWENLKEAIGTN